MMSDEDPKSILADFGARRWEANPIERSIRLRREDPASAAKLVGLAFDELPDSGTIVDAALSFVSETEFDALISTALSRLEDGSGADVAESVIAYASLQFPRLLHPHLERIFELSPNEGTYYECWPWREAPVRELEFLNAMLPSDSKALTCMLEMRSTRSLEMAARSAKSLEDVGFESPESRLYSDRVMHLIFPRDYFEGERPVWLARDHPTWSSSSEIATARFGGPASTVCGMCHQPAHHLLTLPYEVSPIGKELSIVACLSCLGWEEPRLFYDHTETPPRSLNASEEAKTPEFPVGPLKETEVIISLTPERWKWQDWALSNSRENLNRIFGHPCWIQSADYPQCPKCKRTMHFLMQLDSDLPTSDGEEWLWGSGGICYVFLCKSCEVTALFWQCT